MKRILLKASLVLVLIFLTSGCMKLKMNLVVGKDDTVSGSTVLAYSRAAASFSGSGISSALDPNRLFKDKSLITITPYEDNSGYVGNKVTFKKQSIESFKLGATNQTITFKRHGSVIDVNGVIDLTSNGLDTSSNNPEDGFTNSAFDSNDISIKITLPGSISSSTGQVSGNTVTFTGKPGEVIKIQASSDENPSPLPTILWSLALLLAVAIFIWFIWRSNRKGENIKELNSPKDI